MPGSNLGKIRERFEDNGPRWTLWHVLSRGTGRLERWFDARAREIERRRGVPGINSVRRNREVWGTYDWTAHGEEWTMSEPWRESVLATFVRPYLRRGSDVLEIGPGAGRWTVLLGAEAAALYLVDITPTTLDLCRERLGDRPDTHYVLADGTSLGGVPDGSIDFLWSFDVFVHIAPAEQAKYLADFARVMRPGAIAVVHHAGSAGLEGGWRSAMTAQLFEELAFGAGLTVVSQQTSWGDGEFQPSVAGDVITVIRR